MNARRSSAVGGRPAGAVDTLGPLLVLVPAVFLAYLSSLGPVTGVIVAVAGVGGFLALSTVRWARAQALPALPALAALGALAATAPPLPVAELAGGAAGLVLLLAIGRASAAPAQRGLASGGIGIPLLGLLLALATALLLPTTEQLVGVAALFALGAAAAMAMLLAEPDEGPDGGSPAS